MTHDNIEEDKIYTYKVRFPHDFCQLCKPLLYASVPVRKVKGTIPVTILRMWPITAWLSKEQFNIYNSQLAELRLMLVASSLKHVSGSLKLKQNIAYMIKQKS